MSLLAEQKRALNAGSRLVVVVVLAVGSVETGTNHGSEVRESRVRSAPGESVVGNAEPGRLVTRVSPDP